MNLFETLPTSWNLSSLGELSTSVQYGLSEKATYDDSGILCIRITDISDNGQLDITEPKYLPENTPHISNYILEPGDALIARSGSVGLGYVYKGSDSPWVFASYLIRFRLDQRLVEPEYIGFFLRSPFYWHYVNNVARGVTVQNINSKQLSRLPIPLPTLSEQHEIVKIISQTDRLCQLRTKANSKSESLASAIFNSIFGFLDKNTPYQQVRLEKIAEIVSGVTMGRNLPAHETVNVPYLRVANVQAGYLDLSEIKTIDVLPADVEKYALQQGDVLLTEGGDFDKLGRGAIWEKNIPNCIHQNHVFRVRVNREILLPLFFHYYLQTAYARHYFLRAAKRTTNLASINMSQLSDLPVPLPRLELQEKFVNSINQVRSILATQQQSSTEIDRLAQAVMIRAFTGELTQFYRKQNISNLTRLANERDLILRQPSLAVEQLEEIKQIPKRSIVQTFLSASQRALLNTIEEQDAYITNDNLELENDLTLNEVRRNLDLLTQLGLIKAVSVQVTPGELGRIFFTRTYRALHPDDDIREADLAVLREAQEE